MDKTTHFVFVYGSSRRGQVESCGGRAQFVNLACVEGYRLYRLSFLERSYAIPVDPGESVLPLSGEVYEIDEECLLEMDLQHRISEGLYERVMVEASFADGSLAQVWIYEGARVVPVEIESGDWQCRGVLFGKA